MSPQSLDPAAELSAAVATYTGTNDYGALLERLLALAEVTEPDALARAAEPYLTIPEVSGPLYERIVAARPNDARALVILANAYWLTGRGAEATGELAARALAADPDNRGAWHLWALTEGVPRERMMRWKQIVERFPEDDLARASLADNATSLASAERDREALQIAIRSYEMLRRKATNPDQLRAVEQALATLRSWTL
jgi:tetratricopeptide (TPR) repeat protein